MAFDLRIGTSGWQYKHWVGPVYPPKWPSSKMLAWYQEHFDTVEINNSFYHLPAASAVENWRESTPSDFRFAVKGSRFLTHMKKLKNPAAGIEKFFSRIDLLKGKLGVVLFQLPPNFEINAERLEGFLEALPPLGRYTFEFRHESWHAPEILRLLHKHNAAWCAFELDGHQSPVEITADFAYVRLHGPGGKYQGNYSDKTLRRWAHRIRGWRKDLKAVCFYFDNDDSGYAVKNALRLRELAA